MASPVTPRCSARSPLYSAFPVSSGVSVGRFNKHLVGRVRFSLSPPTCSVTFSNRPSNESPFRLPVSLSANSRGTRGYLRPISCAPLGNPTPESENPAIASIRGSIESVKTQFARLTPIDVCKCCAVIVAAISILKWTVNFSWPWLLAIGIGAYGIHCLRKFNHGKATVFEQFALVTSASTWLTLVPPAFFNGHVHGWPVVFFFLYHYFIFFNTTLRKLLYDPKWDVSVPWTYRALFCAAVAVGHWLAAFEGPKLIHLSGGCGFIWLMIMMTLFMQHHATYYLAKYSEQGRVPSVVVRFGPYRLVRHPIYTSTLLLFMTYFTALEAPLSAIYIAVVCVVFYNQKAVLEEAVLSDEFGESYAAYTKKVPHKFIPYVF